MKFLHLVPLLWELLETAAVQEQFECSFHEELIFKPPCGDYSCWDSQLTDLYRSTFIHSLNQFRSNVASGKCYGCNPNEIYENMFALNWHWRLEYEAQKLMKEQECPISASNLNYELSGGPEDDINDVKYYGEVFANSITFEYAATSLPHPAGVATIQAFSTCLRNVDWNCFKTWDKNKKFRRAVMNYVGCAVVVKNNVTGMTGIGVEVFNDRVAHFLCVFSSPVTNYYGILGSQLPNPQNCKKLTGLTKVTKGSNPHLCAYENLSNRYLEIPCQIYVPYISSETHDVYLGKPCDGPVPEYFKIVTVDYESETNTFKMFLKNGTVLNITVAHISPMIPVEPEIIIIRLKPQITKTASYYQFKFCFILALIYLVIVSVSFLTISLILKFYVEKRYLTAINRK